MDSTPRCAIGASVSPRHDSHSLVAGKVSALVLALTTLLVARLPAADLPPTLRTEDGGAEMVLIPAGPLVMGSQAGAPEESPPHRRELPSFYSDRTEVTGRPRYLEAARALADCLAREQAPTGKFNIRWDNRIAFFNRIAASGLLSLNELELKAPVTGPRDGWALELNAVTVLRVEGFLPYWSARSEDWFNPAQPGATGSNTP